MTIFKEGVPEDFKKPTELPEDSEQNTRWQQANRSWWEAHPMRYDWRESVGEEFSREFFEEIDRRHFASLRGFMPWQKIPLEPLVDYEALPGQDVLEIGVGSGAHAQLLASHARSFNGIDLTEYAVESTSKRMQTFGIDARIQRMDAEHMEFPDESFDFVWSWGVIHHSANTRQILWEIQRVLRPGGRCGIMVYHRSLWFYYVMRGIIPGVLGGQLFRGRPFSEIVQGGTDGAIARYYSVPEWKAAVSEFFELEDVFVCGQKNELIPLPGRLVKLKEVLERAMPDAFARFLLQTCRQGSFVVSTQRKPEHGDA